MTTDVNRPAVTATETGVIGLMLVALDAGVTVIAAAPATVDDVEAGAVVPAGGVEPEPEPEDDGAE